MSRSEGIETLFEAPGEYEYGIVYESAQDEPHRSGMTQDGARKWLEEWVDTGANASAVSLIRRWKEPWERVR